MYKKVVLVLLAILLLVTISSCGIRKRVSDGILDGIFGKDVDIDEDGITIENEDGEFTIGSSKWPKGKAADLLPEFKEGVIASSMNTDEEVYIILGEVKESYFNDYINQIKAKGFTEEANEGEYEDMVSYLAYKGDVFVSLTYSKDSETVNITLGHEDES